MLDVRVEEIKCCFSCCGAVAMVTTVWIVVLGKIVVWAAKEMGSFRCSSIINSIVSRFEHLVLT